MRLHSLRRQQRIGAELDPVFAFFSHAHNLEQITPPWLRFEIVTPGPVEMAAGTLIDYRLRLHGVPMHWRTRIEAWEPGRMFADRQLRGPYALWYHRHEFEPNADGTLVRDIVHYALPGGALGDLALPVVRRDLTRIFDYRHAAAERALLG